MEALHRQTCPGMYNEKHGESQDAKRRCDSVVTLFPRTEQRTWHQYFIKTTAQSISMQSHPPEVSSTTMKRFPYKFVKIRISLS